VEATKLEEESILFPIICSTIVIIASLIFVSLVDIPFGKKTEAKSKSMEHFKMNAHVRNGF
jgi:hypothetical protein